MTTTTQRDSLDDMVAAAEAATVALEGLNPGAWTPDDGRRGEPAPWAETSQAGEQALQALRAAAIADLFPDRVVPVGSDLWADFDAYTKPTSYDGARMARMHGAALDGHADLAVVFRTAHVLGMVMLQRGEHEAAFVTGVAEQLAERGECLPASRVLAADLATLRARIGTAQARCQAEAEARSRAELAAWFREHFSNPNIPAHIGNEMLSGSEIAGRIDAGDEGLIDLARHFWLHNPAGGGQATRGRAIFA